MHANHPNWINHWSMPKYPKTAPDHHPRGYGTDHEPDQQIWLTTILNTANIQEGQHIIDYGSGPGRLANALSQYYKEFTYTGLEPPWIPGPIKQANQAYGHDPRIKFTFTNNYQSQKAIQKAHHAILASVLTHLDWEHSKQVLQNLQPILDNNGTITLTVFLAREYCKTPKWPKHKDSPQPYHTKVFLTPAQITDYTQEHNIKAQITDTFLAQRSHLHTVIKLTKN